MLDPFNDSPSLGMELREAWKEIEALKLQNAQLKNERDVAYKENDELRNRIKFLEEAINDFIVGKSKND